MLSCKTQGLTAQRLPTFKSTCTLYSDFIVATIKTLPTSMI